MEDTVILFITKCINRQMKYKNISLNSAAKLYNILPQILKDEKA
jgi:hypothetical protein